MSKQFTTYEVLAHLLRLANDCKDLAVNYKDITAWDKDRLNRAAEILEELRTSIIIEQSKRK